MILIVTKALPANTGRNATRLPPSASSFTQSEAIAVPRRAAIRGKRSLPIAVAPPMNILASFATAATACAYRSGNVVFQLGIFNNVYFIGAVFSEFGCDARNAVAYQYGGAFPADLIGEFASRAHHFEGDLF